MIFAEARVKFYFLLLFIRTHKGFKCELKLHFWIMTTKIVSLVNKKLVHLFKIVYKQQETTFFYHQKSSFKILMKMILEKYSSCNDQRWIKDGKNFIFWWRYLLVPKTGENYKINHYIRTSSLARREFKVKIIS